MPRIMIKGGVWRNTEVSLFHFALCFCWKAGVTQCLFVLFDFLFQDEILKAAVMKYGKTNGHVLLRCCTENQPSSVKLVGTSGWIQVSRKLSGAEKKMRNFFIWPNSCQLSGEPLHLLWAELLLSVWSAMNIFCKITLLNLYCAR